MTSENVILALASGTIGAIGAQILSIWHAQRLEKERQRLAQKLEKERQAFEIHRMKLDVLRKIGGARAGVTERPLLEHFPRFIEGLNEVMILFSDSNEVAKALIEYKAALNTPNQFDRLIQIFKAICRDVGIDPSAFNDSLFLQPFSPGPR